MWEEDCCCPGNCEQGGKEQCGVQKEALCLHHTLSGTAGSLTMDMLAKWRRCICSASKQASYNPKFADSYHNRARWAEVQAVVPLALPGHKL